MTIIAWRIDGNWQWLERCTRNPVGAVTYRLMPTHVWVKS